LSEVRKQKNHKARGRGFPLQALWDAALPREL